MSSMRILGCRLLPRFHTSLFAGSDDGAEQLMFGRDPGNASMLWFESGHRECNLDRT